MHKVIRIDFAKSALNESVQTDAFLQQINALRYADLADANGNLVRRFSETTVAHMKKLLVDRGRDFSDAILQLTHLVRAAAAASDDGEAQSVLLALKRQATGPNMRSELRPQFAQVPFITGAEGAAFQFVYSCDATDFALGYGRATLLLALYNFLLAMPVEEDELDRLLGALADCEKVATDRRAILQASNTLASVVIRALNSVMNGPPPMRRWAKIIQFLDESAETDADDGMLYWTIEDESILTFWEAQANADSTENYKKYVSAAAHFLGLVKAYREGADSIQARMAAPDLDSLYDLSEEAAANRWLEGGEAPSDPLAPFAVGPLSEMAFLSSAQIGRASNALAAAEYLRDFPKTVYRSSVMGLAQNKISNALRFEGTAAVVETSDLFEASDGYLAQAEDWSKLGDQVGRSRWAAIHVAARDPEVALSEDDARRARDAFNKISRKEFVGAAKQKDLGADFIEAAHSLQIIEGLLRSLIAAGPEKIGLNFTTDRKKFSSVFETIYRLEQ